MYGKRKFDYRNPNRDGYGFGFFTGAAALVGATSIAAGVAVVGAGIMAAGSVLGIKEAAPIGGLMMAGGGIASGLSGLGLLGGGAGAATTTLGTLSAGASLVGGALQGVGILTGNSKLSGIGGLINGAGMMGTSFDSGALSGGGTSATNGVESQYVNNNFMHSPGMPTIENGVVSGGGGLRNADIATNGVNSGNTPPFNPAAAGPADSKLLNNINKYDSIIKLGGDFAKGMATSKQQNDILNQNAMFQSQNLAEHRRNTTAVAIPGSIPVSAPTIPVMAQQVVPNAGYGMLNTNGQQVLGVA